MWGDASHETAITRSSDPRYHVLGGSERALARLDLWNLPGALNHHSLFTMSWSYKIHIGYTSSVESPELYTACGVASHYIHSDIGR